MSKSKHMKHLFHVSSWNRTQKNDGVILNISAFDKDSETWYNARVYVPFGLREGQTYAKTTLAKASRISIPSDKERDATQTASCAVIRVPVERTFEAKDDAPKKKRSEDDNPFDED